MSQVTFPYAQGTYGWTSPYGYRVDPLGRTSGQSFHGGVDLAPKQPGLGLVTHAPVTGTVTVPAYESGGAGHNIWVTDTDGVLWKVFHLARIDVRTGQRVSAGDPVAIMGRSGASTGIHGHIERWEHGRRTDPTPHLRDAEAAGRFPGTPIPQPTPTPEDIMATRAELQSDLSAALKPITERLTALEQLVVARGNYWTRDERDGAMWVVAGDRKSLIPDPDAADVLKTFLPERQIGAATLDALPSEPWAA